MRSVRLLATLHAVIAPHFAGGVPDVWPRGIDVPGQVVSEAYAINNTGLIAGKSNFYPVVWTCDFKDPASTPQIAPLPIPEGFFSATTTAVNDLDDVVGYAGSPGIDAHAILWRHGVAIDLGVWPRAAIAAAPTTSTKRARSSGVGTVAADNLDHALLWTIADARTIGDCNGDGKVDGSDLGLLLGAWGAVDAGADLNGDGAVDRFDLGLLLGAWAG